MDENKSLNEFFHNLMQKKFKADLSAWQPNGDLSGVFKKFAKYIFENFCIYANKKRYIFTDIEFYYSDEYQGDGKHKDPFCHKDIFHAQTDTLRFHYSGMDIRFGSDKEFGGILIRGVYPRPDGVNRNGPLISVCSLLNAASLGQSLDFVFKKEKGVQSVEETDINEATRVGINKVKTKEPQKQEYKGREYRFYIDK